MTDYYLDHFLKAHEAAFPDALRELEAGEKQGHWMWFIFPQFAGLGRSDVAQYFAIESLGEALSFITDPTLGANYQKCVEAVLRHPRTPPEAIFGIRDTEKFRSSLTLFREAEVAGLRRQRIDDALETFFGNELCSKTQEFITKSPR